MPAEADLTFEHLIRDAERARDANDWIHALAFADTALTFQPRDRTALKIRADARVRMANQALRAEFHYGNAGLVEIDEETTARRAAVPREAATAVERLGAAPALLDRLLKLLSDDAATADAVARVVSSDPGVTADVLRIANSAYYGRPLKVDSLRDAIVTIGFEEVGRIAVASSLMERGAGASVRSIADFWRFSLTVATLADLQARIDGIGRKHSFTAGVLHRIGLLAMDLVAPDGLREALEMKDVAGLARLSDRQRAVLGYTDAELGAEVARRWQLPLEYARTIERSHQRPDEIPEDDPVTRFVVRARILARSQGMHDGAESNDMRPVPALWASGPLASNLKRIGGLQAIQDRTTRVFERLAA